MLRKLFLWGSRSAWLRERVPRMRLARRAVRRFMPGEELASALAAAEEFRGTGTATVLTNLGENVTDLAQAAAVARHYGRVLEQVGRRGLDAEISIKLTHLGFDLDGDAVYENLLRLLERARALGNYVWVDMEGSDYTDATLELVCRARREHPNVGVCVQAYLYRTGRDLDRLLALGCGVRLVKGAYDEPAEIAYRRRSDVDRSYLELAERLLEEGAGGRNGVRVAFATHDGRLIDRIREAAGSNGMGRDGFEFQMLYGIRRDLQRRLVDEGYDVRVLISYGEAWFPWYMRRLAERPANVLFAARALVGAG
ncbi:MAG: proline dehydrogenase family protein [Gemmatimonadota bacterium]